MLDKEEIDAAAGESSHLIELEEFVHAAEIDPVFYAKTYYLGVEVLYSQLNSATTGTGELASGFFQGTTPSDFAVATNLANGSQTVKQAAAVPLATDMQTNRTITAAGVTFSNVTYAGFTNAIVSQQNQNLSTVKTSADLYSSQVSTYTQKLQSSTGVNIDDELATLTQLQNNYAASARVLTTIQSMYQSLEEVT